jgi:hypothetical protein
MPIPDTRYAMAGDIAVAYQVFGSGERRVLAVPPVLASTEVRIRSRGESKHGVYLAISHVGT